MKSIYKSVTSNVSTLVRLLEGAALVVGVFAIFFYSFKTFLISLVNNF